jgi:hypothetical protein
VNGGALPMLMSRRRRPQGLFWSGAAKLRGHASQPIHHMPFEARAAQKRLRQPMLRRSKCGIYRL